MEGPVKAKQMFQEEDEAPIRYDAELKGKYITTGKRRRLIADWERVYADVPEGLASAHYDRFEWVTLVSMFNLATSAKAFHRNHGIPMNNFHNDIFDDVYIRQALAKGLEGKGAENANKNVNVAISEERATVRQGGIKKVGMIPGFRKEVD